MSAERVVLLVLDGLGWNQLRERPHLAPTLTSMSGGPITSVAPSTTATALTSITTGLAPGEHGLIGYRMGMGGTVMNTLRWADEKGDLRRQFPPGRVQSCPPFLGLAVPVLSKAELEGTGFTEAHLAGVKPMGWRAASSIAVTTAAAFAAGEKFVYAYYDGVDKIAHERGFGEYYDAELVHADALVRSVLDRLPPSSALVVTADHGECLGEQGLYGHAIHHEKVLEVPLLIFRLNAPPHAAPETNAEKPSAGPHGAGRAGVAAAIPDYSITSMSASTQERSN